MHEILTEHSAF